MVIKDRVQQMTNDELISAANGNGGACGYDDGLASVSDWSQVASEELKRRGVTGLTDFTIQSDPISADAHHIAASVTAGAGRIVKHLWIIFVALPFALGVAFWILLQAAK
jgi:hypothetical protein